MCCCTHRDTVVHHGFFQRITPDQGPHTPQSCSDDTNGNQSVHCGGAVTSVLHCRFMEWPSTPCCNGKREGHRPPLPSTELPRHHHAENNNGDRHCCRENQAHTCLTQTRIKIIVIRVVVDNTGSVSGINDCLNQCGLFDGRAIKCNHRGFRCVIHCSFHAINAIEGFLDTRRACPTGHSLKS